MNLQQLHSSLPVGQEGLHPVLVDVPTSSKNLSPFTPLSASGGFSGSPGLSGVTVRQHVLVGLLYRPVWSGHRSLFHARAGVSCRCNDVTMV